METPISKTRLSDMFWLIIFWLPLYVLMGAEKSERNYWRHQSNLTVDKIRLFASSSFPRLFFWKKSTAIDHIRDAQIICKQSWSYSECIDTYYNGPETRGRKLVEKISYFSLMWNWYLVNLSKYFAPARTTSDYEVLWEVAFEGTGIFSYRKEKNLAIRYERLARLHAATLEDEIISRQMEVSLYRHESFMSTFEFVYAGQHEDIVELECRYEKDRKRAVRSVEALMKFLAFCKGCSPIVKIKAYNTCINALSTCDDENTLAEECASQIAEIMRMNDLHPHQVPSIYY